MILLGYHVLRALMLKRIHVQHEVKLIKATARIYRVAMEVDDGEQSENGMAWEHLLDPVV